MEDHTAYIYIFLFTVTLVVASNQLYTAITTDTHNFITWTAGDAGPSGYSKPSVIQPKGRGALGHKGL